MLRIRVVQDLLISGICALKPTGDGRQSELEQVQKAQRKALFVAVVDWLAILVLVLFRQRPGSVIDFGAGAETVFSFGILAVATHAGFRLGHAEKLTAVRRSLEELPLSDSESEGSRLS